VIPTQIFDDDPSIPSDEVIVYLVADTCTAVQASVAR